MINTPGVNGGNHGQEIHVTDWTRQEAQNTAEPSRAEQIRIL